MDVYLKSIFSVMILGMSATLAAQGQIPVVAESSDQTVEYSTEFFARYQPNTALDMVNQVPGFQVDDGDATRGFAGAAGNILINGRRPSAKQDRPSAILSRIPASQVLQVELIRGQVRGIDLRGQSSVVNVLLSDDAPAAIRWESFLLYSSSGPIKPGLKASFSDRWKDIEYNFGIGIERNANGEDGPEFVYDSNGELIEQRYDQEKETGLTLHGLFMNASTWIGDTLFQLNGKFGLVNAPEVTDTRRNPLFGDPLSLYIKDAQHSETYELGVDAERSLSEDLVAKAILLYINKLSDVTSTQHNRDSVGELLLFRQADTISDATEGIARLEFDWSGLQYHAVQLNLEGAYNLLEGSLFQTENVGAGTVIVDVPGANVRVAEYRGDFLLKDTWSLGQFELDYGLGAEVSTISQTGDEELKRTFSFLTPQASLSYSPAQGEQSRIRLAREVSQLNFNDFVSTTVFEDDDLALGNPNLHPDTTWVAEMSHERRFGRISVIKVMAFHHWISDVLDLLPLTSTYAVPGNIGDGRRWGVEMEGTVPLDWMGLAGSRLDIKLRWQNSSVIDPVTGQKRVLSANPGFSGPPNIKFREENRYVFDIAYRQDFEQERLAWGWRAAQQAERPLFKVDEMERYNEGTLINIFIETTRWFGLKVRLEGNNLLNYIETRDRIIFAGGRDLTPVSTRIFRERVAGRRADLVVSGSF